MISLDGYNKKIKIFFKDRKSKLSFLGFSIGVDWAFLCIIFIILIIIFSIGSYRDYRNINTRSYIDSNAPKTSLDNSVDEEKLNQILESISDKEKRFGVLTNSTNFDTLTNTSTSTEVLEGVE